MKMTLRWSNGYGSYVPYKYWMETDELGVIQLDTEIVEKFMAKYKLTVEDFRGYKSIDACYALLDYHAEDFSHKKIESIYLDNDEINIVIEI